jgi:cobyric acid synthase CobQ
MLELKNLSVGYDKQPLQNPFSLLLKKGEILTLIGANGAGKSTILKTIIKQLEPVAGAIYIEENELKSLSLKELSKKTAALLTLSIKPELMTCRDVVEMGRYPHTNGFGILTDEDKKAVDEAIQTVHAQDFAQKDFMRVSDGQKQRILFARALCQNPRILVLDEPTSYLDIKWRLELLKILRDLANKGVTVIASMHEIDLALKVSDRILCVGANEIKELSADEDECKAQIRKLYDLPESFYIEETFYSELVKKFCSKLRGAVSPLSQKSNAFSLMVQGTMSSAGKSFVVAGLCRIFKQDGFSVAPFKSQNMALNSFVTSEGLEMGRAQVMQAEAAGVEPSVLMNPILLKPNSDTGSQVIVNGEVLGDMGAKEYFAFKKSLVPQIKAAFEKLAGEHQVIVIEGAGSPAEINLKENDIVNMGMAEIADSPVLLVADIDRGGVFAQLLGTIELLEPNERKRIKGMIINKFRGDKSILDSGIRMIEEKTGIPVVGTLPYMKIQLDDEDSLSTNLHTLAKYRDKKDEIQLAVVRLPHISNFTDFIPLQNLPFVNLYYACEPKDLGFPDCIIIPGTKNTPDDLQWLKDSGFAELIQNEANKGTAIVGICGGFQILGDLSLLPVSTVFSSQKTRTRVSGKVAFDGESIFSSLAGLSVSGYEIHMGQTEFASGAEKCYFSQITDSVSGETKLDGAVKGNIFGTYIHGLFDEAEFCRKFIEVLAVQKGINSGKWSQISNVSQESSSIQEFKESQYNLLAETLRKHLDMKKIYEIVGLAKESF